MERKYNTKFRKIIQNKLNNIVDKQQLINIYKIIENDKITINNNNILFDLNKFSDKTIEELKLFFDKSM